MKFGKITEQDIKEIFEILDNPNIGDIDRLIRRGSEMVNLFYSHYPALEEYLPLAQQKKEKKVPNQEPPF